jgi:hypothetical protein
VLHTGQVRRMSSPTNEHSCLVGLLHAREDQITVVLLLSAAHGAGERELMLSSTLTGTPFDLTVATDSVMSVRSERLNPSPVYGHLSENVLWIARRAHWNRTTWIQTHAARLGLTCGPIRVQSGDHLWWQRARAAENFLAAGQPEREGLNVKG